MSHFSTITVQIKQGDVLYQTLNDLGYSVERNVKVRGYAGNRVRADYVIRQSNGYDVGFRFNGETYELVADLWGVKADVQNLVDTITQAYAHSVLMTSVQEQGFNVEEEETLADGTIRVVVGKWV
ncbi:MAG: DUF1257 domain-containing protein [Elainellaceae cyanobacterium]